MPHRERGFDSRRKLHDLVIQWQNAGLSLRALWVRVPSRPPYVQVMQLADIPVSETGPAGSIPALHTRSLRLKDQDVRLST